MPGQGAYSYIQNFLPDITLLDTPSMEGKSFDFINGLREDAATACIPVIVLTEKFIQDEFRAFIEAGADDYLPRGSKTEILLKATEVQFTKIGKVKRNFEDKLNEFKRYLTSVMPHEFNTPLTAILGFTDALKSEHKNLSAPEFEEMLNYIRESALRLKSTADKFIVYSDVLALTTILAAEEAIGSSSVLIEPSLFTRLINDDEFIRARAADIEINVAEGRIVFMRDYIASVIRELLENACKFSAPGTRITIQGRTILYKYHLQITDEGVGLPRDFAYRISAFNQYSRDKYEQQGLGLGLAIVKTAVQAFGGELDFESANGKKTIAKLLFRMPD